MIESVDCEGMDTNRLRYQKPDLIGLRDNGGEPDEMDFGGNDEVVEMDLNDEGVEMEFGEI
jgi:hypothetical protein